MSDEIELTEAEQQRVEVALAAAEDLEIARIRAERDRVPHAHLIRPAADADPFQCPDCSRGIQAHRTAPVLICASLAITYPGPGQPDPLGDLLLRAKAGQVIACGLDRAGVPLEAS